jgi:hypothetical protein
MDGSGRDREKGGAETCWGGRGEALQVNMSMVIGLDCGYGAVEMYVP